MRRRDFVKVIAGSVIGWPLPARAQQPSGPVIGFLSTDSPDESGPVVAAFREGLVKTGYIDGKNVVIEWLKVNMIGCLRWRPILLIIR